MPPKRKTRSANEDSAPAESSAAGAETDAGSKLQVPSPSALTLEDVQSAISRYSDHVSKLAGSKPDSKLQELDEWRLGVLQELVRSREPAWIDKDELKKLMDWKLTRGKFRPTLPGLVAQNAPDKVKSSTQEAFTSLSQLSPSSTPDIKAFRGLLKSLCADLKGVGPATGSLVLSVYDDRVPFMSDEAYVWVMYADGGGSGKTKREIKYTEKGYADFAVRMWEVAEQAGVAPVELERAGWVLGREWIAGAELRLANVAEEKTETAVVSADGPTSSGKSKRQKR